MKRLLFVILLIIPVVSAHAVCLIDRGNRYDPFIMDPDSGNGICPSAYGWGEFARFVYRTDQNHYWMAKLGAYGEFFRIQDRFSLVLNSDLQLTASSNNLFIAFGPRAFYWHESLVFYMKFGQSTFGAGYYHRCKHDVDNLNIFLMNNVYYARTLIWDSIVLKWTLRPVNVKLSDKLSFDVMAFADNHYYVIKQDGVSAEYGSRVPSYTNLIDTVSIGARLDFPAGMVVHWYIQPQMTFDLYHIEGATFLTTDCFLETGVGLNGKAFDFDIFMRYETIYDTGVDPFLTSGEYVMLGLKVR